MSHKGPVITQADVGSSLAQLYDTQGSRAGGPNAEIEADRILLVHEMGHMIFSERYFLRVRQVSSGAVAQSTSFLQSVTDFGANHWKIQGITVAMAVGDAAGDIAFMTVSALSRLNGREVPIFMWDSTSGDSFRARFDDGTGVADHIVLAPRVPIATPLMMGTAEATQLGASDLIIRGTTAAFGAGTTTVVAHVLVASVLPSPGQVSAPGLPIPSW